MPLFGDLFGTTQIINQLADLKVRLVRMELNMITTTDFQSFADDLNREVGQIKDFIAGLEEQIATGADNAAFRAFVEAALPGLKANVGELDKFTPEPPAPVDGTPV